MKLICRDGVTREFTTCKKLAKGAYTEAICNECKQSFGIGPTELLKSLFKQHMCNETPCKLKSGDAPFQFLSAIWNVTEALKYCKANLKPCIMGKEMVVNYYNNFVKPLIYVNENHARTVDLSLPGILVEISENPVTCILIDGNHRLTRAYNEGKEFICYKISFNQQLEFITTVDGIRNIKTYNKSMKKGS